MPLLGLDSRYIIKDQHRVSNSLVKQLVSVVRGCLRNTRMGRSVLYIPVGREKNFVVKSCSLVSVTLQCFALNKARCTTRLSGLQKG